MDSKIAIFQGKGIRKTIHNNEWWFSVHDVVAVLTGSTDSREYFNKILQRDEQLKSTYGQFVHKLDLVAQDNKLRKQLCANTEGIFRIIQAIPSPKAEPFKRWLAKVGYERIQEIEDPELASNRARQLYQAKGYSAPWIEKRLRGIAVRQELTDEWRDRGILLKAEYSILTAEISKATFGLTPSEYKELKQLDRENLRDHMTDLELIFSMLGEASTTEIARRHDAQGFDENSIAAKKGGDIAGGARQKLEQETGRRVISSDNYLDEPESVKRLGKRRP